MATDNIPTGNTPQCCASCPYNPETLSVNLQELKKRRIAALKTKTWTVQAATDSYLCKHVPTPVEEWAGCP